MLIAAFENDRVIEIGVGFQIAPDQAGVRVFACYLTKFADSTPGIAAGEAGDVSHIIYLAALQLDEGESMVPADTEFPTRDGDVLLPDDDSRHLFYADVPADEADRAVARLRPQSVRSCLEVVTRVAWKTIPSTYVVCEQDNVLPPAFQEQMASRATTVRRLLTGHSPFLSSPAEVAKLITTVIADAAPAR